MEKHWGLALLIVFALLSMPLAVSAAVVERQPGAEVALSNKITTCASQLQPLEAAAKKIGLNSSVSS